MLYLEEANLSLTIDIIGRVVMDPKNASQTTHNDLTTALRKQLEWCTTVGLALKSYLAENPSATGINAEFQDLAMAQTKLFIFAGHDTTSAGAIFTYHLLTQHPSILAKVHAEHDVVFGPTESLRIYPTVAALRDGQPDFFISSESGKSLPTDHCLVWGDRYGTHHNPRYWARPEEFLPERFLVAEGDELYPPKNAWRPFERGPRNCIGQELALTEIKVMLALTIREFDFKDDYEAYDASKKNPKGWNVNGQRAYMMLRGRGHPADHYPCKVTFAHPEQEKNAR